MSKETVATVRAIYDEWAKGNLAAGIDLYDPDIVFIPTGDTPDSRRFIGVQEIEGWMRRWLQAWDDFVMSAEEFIDAGDSVVVAVRQRGVGKKSGIPSERSYFQIWTFRGPA